MIYSASRRTDLVAFYPDAITERVRRARKLEAMVLWTKDPRPLATHPGLRLAVEAVPTVVQLTLTGLGGTVWEPRVPPPEALAGALRDLGERLPPGAVRWRFDPILDTGDAEARFGRMLALLRGSLGTVEEAVVSFPDPYAKVVRRLAKRGMALPALDAARKRELLERLHGSGGLPLALCCEPELLDRPFVRPSRCIDGALFDRLYGTSLGDLPKDPGQRAACGCVRSTDIGSYEQVCGHGCLYCYANPEI